MNAASSRTTTKAPKLDFGGMLPPAPPPPAPAPAATPVEKPPAPAEVTAPRQRRADGDAAVPRAATVTPARRKRRRRTSTAADEGTGVYLPVSLVDRLRVYARSQEGRTYTDITLDAVEATHDQLGELLRPSGRMARSGPLFAGRQSRRVPHAEAHQQVNLRFSAADLTVIDELVGEVGAPNRSAMLAAALREYLPPE